MQTNIMQVPKMTTMEDYHNNSSQWQ